MSYETDLFTSIIFSHRTLDSLYEVDSAIEEEDKLIKYYENTLYSMGLMTEPKKFCGEEDDPVAFINGEIKNALDGLKESYVEKFKLELARETWDKTHDKDGYAIKRPSNVPWDAAYIEGDYIKYRDE